MELRYKREATVGALMIVGAALFVFLMMWLRGQRWSAGQLVHVEFTDVAGLKVGDPVRTSGVNVGQVQRIELLSPGRVDVLFDVSKGQTPRADAGAVVKPMDLFGARYIEYSPGVADTPLSAGQVVTGRRQDDMAEMAEVLSGRGERLIENANGLTQELREALVDARQLMRTLDAGSAGASRELVGALEDLRHVLQRIDLIAAQNAPVVSQTAQGLQRATANLDTLALSLTRTTNSLDSILAKVNRGQGVAGALVNDTSLVGELRTTNAALRDLLVDLKANPSRYIRLRL